MLKKTIFSNLKPPEKALNKKAFSGAAGLNPIGMNLRLEKLF